GNGDGVAGGERLGRLAPFLIPAAAGGAQENLAAALVGVVNVPVVAAARLKGDVGGGDTVFARQHLEIAVAHKILGVGVVGLAQTEDAAVGLLGGLLVGPDLFGHPERGPGLGPAGVKGGVGDDLGDLGAGDAVLLCGGQMILEGA